MAFQLDQDQPIAVGIVRVASQQIKRAGRDLDDLPADTAVHEIRKRFKRVRALARLLREPLGERRYGRTNEVIRDAGKPLAELRDAEAVMTALEKLGRSRQMEEMMVSPLRQGLKRHYNAVREKLSDEDRCAATSEAWKKARKAVRQWRIKARGWQAIRAGLTDTYQKAQESLATAMIDPSIANLHEWRKQAKYLWNEIEFLKPLRRRALGQLANKLHRLTDLLGDDHDLAVLAQTVESKQHDWGAAAAAQRLLPLVHLRRERWQQKAFRLGQRIFQLPPRRFVANLKRRGRRQRAERPGRLVGIVR